MAAPSYLRRLLETSQMTQTEIAFYCFAGFGESGAGTSQC